MTDEGNKSKIMPYTVTNTLAAVILTALVFMTAIYLSDDLGEFVRDALNLSARIIIPSIFPFILLTDIIMPYVSFEGFRRLNRAFEKLFKISAEAIPSLICGMLCGFPIGAKMAEEYYRCGILTNDERERLWVISSCASPAYVISAVGVTMRGSVRDGIILYISMISSAFICGIILKRKEDKTSISRFIIRQKYSFVNSVKSASLVCINAAAFISTFGIVIGLIKMVIKNEVILGVASSLLELGNASKILADSVVIPPVLSLSLTSFAISFSGLSVIFQTLAIQNQESKINTGLYVRRKLLQGIISSLITYIIFSFTLLADRI